MLYSRRGLQTRISDVLGRRIVSGEIPEGATLDLDGAESEFQVSRTVIREAVKVLSARGLLDARPRTGTYVLPRSSWNLLDADVMAWRAESGGLTAELLRELDELRQMVEPWAAKVAASKHTPEHLVTIRESLTRMENAYTAFHKDRVGRLSEHVQADIDFHTAILRATGNELVSHMDMMLKPLLQFRDELIPEGEQSAQFLPAHQAVLDAIEARDPNRAEARMRELLEAAAHDLNTVIDGTQSRRSVND